jgi:hypothetical protein
VSYYLITNEKFVLTLFKTVNDFSVDDNKCCFVIKSFNFFINKINKKLFIYLYICKLTNYLKEKKTFRKLLNVIINFKKSNNNTNKKKAF